MLEPLNYFVTISFAFAFQRKYMIYYKYSMAGSNFILNYPTLALCVYLSDYKAACVALNWEKTIFTPWLYNYRHFLQEIIHQLYPIYTFCKTFGNRIIQKVQHKIKMDMVSRFNQSFTLYKKLLITFSSCMMQIMLATYRFTVMDCCKTMSVNSSNHSHDLS